MHCFLDLSDRCYGRFKMAKNSLSLSRSEGGYYFPYPWIWAGSGSIEPTEVHLAVPVLAFQKTAASASSLWEHLRLGHSLLEPSSQAGRGSRHTHPEAHSQNQLAVLWGSRLEHPSQSQPRWRHNPEAAQWRPVHKRTTLTRENKMFFQLQS